MTSPRSFQENEALIQKAQEGDMEARADLYQGNVGLIYMVLERFKNTSYDYEDLFQIGSIGLLKAIDKFDRSFGVRFSTYAVPMIIGEIKKFLRDDGMVKVQRGIKEVYQRIRWAQDKLRGELGREPSINEIAGTLDIEKEEIVMAMEACQAPAYIYDAFPGDDREPLSLINTLTGEDSSKAILERVALREALDKLEPREKEVIIRRFFRDETQAKIASVLGVSQVQVSRIEKAALFKLRGVMI
ncbi:MAG TPA: SigB/SigF/SigG family RNA polymerase sigma factor [Syntrophomonadaceae bacterium]|nr:SigB/SigF/SigG family RNA polymerase sigma factor [Syntrophomonadaceae bacterium]